MIHPNQLTVLRIILGVVFFSLFPFANDWWEQWLCLPIYVAAGITDFFDGRIARRYNLESDFGKIADPIADKFLVLGAFFTMVYLGVYSVGWIILIAVREIVVTAVRVVKVAQGKVLAAEWSGKVKVIVQYVALGTSFLVLVFQDRLPWGWVVEALRIFLYICLVVANYVCLYSGVRFFQSLKHRAA